MDINCNRDYIKVYDGQDQAGELLGKYCGDTLPPVLQSSGDSIFIEFVSDESTVKEGFRLIWSLAGEK